MKTSRRSFLAILLAPLTGTAIPRHPRRADVTAIYYHSSPMGGVAILRNGDVFRFDNPGWIKREFGHELGENAPSFPENCYSLRYAEDHEARILVSNEFWKMAGDQRRRLGTHG